jgi:uncharacterized tellurite resistance protein B-like protein
MFESFLTKLHDALEDIAPGPETLARREVQALQKACCALLVEVARLASLSLQRKRDVVAAAMQQQFGLSADEAASLVQNAEQSANRLTSYYKPVSLINKRLELDDKVRFVERLWRVAFTDGEIDMYEEQLVR